MALEKLEILVVVMSVELISSTVSMRIDGLIEPVILSKAAKMVPNLDW